MLSLELTMVFFSFLWNVHVLLPPPPSQPGKTKKKMTQGFLCAFVISKCNAFPGKVKYWWNTIEGNTQK